MTGIIFLAIYVAIFAAGFFIITKVVQGARAKDYTSLKTVTFGDESAVRPNRAAGIISIFTIFLMWGIFTGSAWLPSFLHAPGPYEGIATFTYTAEAEGGDRDEATVTVLVHPREEKVEDPAVEPGDGFAKNDTATVAQWRTVLINVDRNDDITKKDGAKVVEINGQKIAPGGSIKIDGGVVNLSDKGTPNFEPEKGWQMESLYLPAPEEVWTRSIKVAAEGFRLIRSSNLCARCRRWP